MPPASLCPPADLQLTPSKCLVEKCSGVAAGTEFSMWLCDGQLWAAGMPQYGMLGDGDDHEYNAKDCGWPDAVCAACCVVQDVVQVQLVQVHRVWCCSALGSCSALVVLCSTTHVQGQALPGTAMCAAWDS